MAKDKYVRFDWAAKRMLRNKANFGVLEGLITVLTRQKMQIVEAIEDEPKSQFDIIRDVQDSQNRVSFIVKNVYNDTFVIELHFVRLLYYYERILYGVAKSITEHIQLGDKYDKVKKVYSISILYFDLGKGADYLYHGQTTFTGVHTGDTLQITTKEKDVIEMKTPEQIFPEYFLIRVNEFNKVATTPLEEWLDYLRSGHIKDDTTAPGLQEARRQLQYMQMPREEQISYDRHLDAIMIQNDVISTAQKEGRAEGRAEERAEREKERFDNIKRMRAKGYDDALIAELLDLDLNYVKGS